MRDGAPRVLPALLLTAWLGCGLSTGGVGMPDRGPEASGWDAATETAPDGDADPPDDTGTPPDEAGTDIVPPVDFVPVDAAAECGNGLVEPGEECETGGSEPCDTACGTVGTRFCVDCRWGACAPPVETCNGVDDDCNGLTDEGCGPTVPNDHCDGAIDISAGGLFPGTTDGAVHDQDHCSISADCDPGGFDVFYRFTLSNLEVVLLSLQDGPEWDAVLTVRAGGCDGPEAACSDDACESRRPQWVGRLPAGSYWVVVDGCDPDDFGAFTLRYAHSPCPGTEYESTRLRGPGTYTGRSCGWGNDTSSACGGNDDDDLPMYFGLCPGARAVGASTCADGELWPSSLSIRTGGGGRCGGTEADCSGALDGSATCYRGRSRVETTLSGPELVFVLLDGAGTGPYCGNFAVEVWY
ncbi:MAG: hypothetical protein JXB32_03085 [Deltaproteobacteria bacterium]|nr:hypothetical protein [Deltaproteobacteria bacterium]